jgi:hypothetical protein
LGDREKGGIRQVKARKATEVGNNSVVKRS